MKSIILTIAIVLAGSMSGVAVVNAGENHNSSRSNTATSIHEKVLCDVERIVVNTGKNGGQKKSEAFQIHSNVLGIVN